MEERSADTEAANSMDEGDFNLLDVGQARIRSHNNVDSQSQQQVLQDEASEKDSEDEDDMPKATSSAAKAAKRDQSSWNDDYDLDLLQVVEARIHTNYREQGVANQAQKQLSTKVADNHGAQMDEDLSTKKKDLPIEKVQDKKTRKQQVQNLGQVVMTPELKKSVNEGTYTASSFSQKPASYSQVGEAHPTILEGDISVGTDATVPENSLPGAYAQAGAPSSSTENVEASLLALRPQDVETSSNTEQHNWNASGIQMTLSSGGSLAVASPVEEDARSLQRDLPLATPHEGDPKTGRQNADTQTRKESKFLRGCLVALGVLIGIVLLLVFLLTDGSNTDVGGIVAAGTATVSTSSPTPAPTSLMDIKHAFLQDLLPSYTLDALLEDKGLWDDEQNASAPQALAYEWMMEDPGLLDYVDWRVQQRFALATFFHATGGPDWYVNDGWLTNYSLHECFWYMKSFSGFVYEEDGLFYHHPIVMYEQARTNPCHQTVEGVVADNTSTGTSTANSSHGIGDGIYKHLWMPENNLQGSIPLEIYELLPALRSISLFVSSFAEAALSSHIGLLTNLEALNLAHTDLQGTLPPSLSQAALTNLILFNNKITGTFPTELALLTDLQTLILDLNPISGSIPTEVGRLEQLLALNVDQTSMTGPIPSEIAQMTSLYELYLYRCQFTGTIPTELGLLSALKQLYIHGQSLTGTIPSELGLLNLTTTLRLYENQLSGVIPSELGLLTAASKLYVHHNILTGIIPSEVGLLTAASKLFFYQNALTGTLPSQIFQLAGLYELAVDENLMDSTVPSELGLLSLLEALYLGSNFFTGTIPSELGLLENLDLLTLNGNNLTGTLPQDVALLPNLTELDLTDTSISGFLPESICDVEKLWFDCSSMLCGCDCSCNTTGTVDSDTTAGIGHQHAGNGTHADILLYTDISSEVASNDTDW